LFLLALAAWLANRVGRGTTVRLGLAALGVGALGWGLGWSSLHPYLAAVLVGCWAFVDVGWWARLGDEAGWTTSYGIGLAAMAGAIGIGLFVTPVLGGVGPLSGAVLALAALLGAALLLPSEASLPQPALPVPDPPVAQDGDMVASLVETTVPSLPVRLSARERRILELLARGASNKEIAQELGIREGTVRTHLERLYRKLGVRSRTEAAAWYWRMVAGREERSGTTGDPLER
ncbi:MAG: helix-turn-helix transcriptional regulator, partial [Thermomicrobium sp.]|nr:helix-turn-helix transcriptional regulator [Thermomicrobium sp.]